MSERIAIRRIRGRRDEVAPALMALRRQLSPQGEVLSPAGRALTERVFGTALTPSQVVERICQAVRQVGLDALLEYSRQLDDPNLTADRIRVSAAEMESSHASVEPQFLAMVRRVRDNIRHFQEAIRHQDRTVTHPDHCLRLLYRPLRRVGICVPGGAAAYPSTILMTVVPAQAAGVTELAVVAPPTPTGANNPFVQAVCWELGVTELYRIGGAQAVAALAYGVTGIAPVDKIVGPGNIFVALAKQRVSEIVGIDSIAGPSEVVVLADASANPCHVAADLLAQAEHSPGSSLLITWAPGLADAVHEQLDQQYTTLDRADLTHDSLVNFGALIEVENEAIACELTNQLAPEHLHIQTADAEHTLAQIHAAGGVFLGPDTPVAVGDYVAGPSHTLPTSGTARFANGLSANDFLTSMSVVEYTRERLAAVAADVRLLAQTEGLTAHARSVDIRLQNPQ